MKITRRHLRELIIETVSSPLRGCETCDLEVAGCHLSAEIANTPSQRKTGLMNRSRMRDNSGMIFVFPKKMYHSFWMKDTLIPLSIAFIDENGRIDSIEDMKPHSLNNASSQILVPYALEVNKGWFDENDVHVGDYVKNLPNWKIAT
mgnify:CR=1 FL=1